MKKIKIIIYSVLAILFLSSCTKETKTEQPIEEKKAEHEEAPQTVATLTEEQMKAVGVKLGTIEVKELTAMIKANGILNVPNSNMASVASMFGGVIQTLPIQEGSYVKKGQVIATISNPEFILTQEQYLTVLSRITYAEQEFRRQKELFDNDAGAKKNLQNSSAELKTLRSQKASLSRQLQMMGINPSKVSNANLRNGMVITAPISGTVSKIIAQIGSYVDVSSPVAEIIDNSSIHLDLQVFEKDLPKMKVGQVIQFELTNNPGNSYEAVVYSIGSSFENESKTIAVHSKVRGNKSGLINGMNITGVVSLSNSFTPAVPNEAIVEADGKFYIFVKTNKKVEEHTDEESKDPNEKNKEHKNEKSINFEKIEVVKGSSNMGYTAITTVNEVDPNAQIVVKGSFFVNAKLSNSGDHGH
ncbi:efflux RND transporter periplasmic adaptor subunit [Empedobacter falsenii]|uniref:Efflux RND transporter periplasmic adaptor subunit n=1 Tax=Empedobacter falsenii TaxID=343874 RepID=A0A427BPD5_9FLAO|nr:efflux RND transporter periplasmic adaptor subunit [Empedobacter falsenii]RRT91883.1 efflux RND transporter periplasmic adaptor subunit [Empedobacter falsenii]RRT92123.1 efflux RND transporter periplasmic adaptor subunit [Empedobacter falsenii]